MTRSRNPLPPFVLLPALLLGQSLSASGTQGQQPTIGIQGLDSAMENNVRAYLGFSKLPCDADNWRLEKAQEQSQLEIQQALQALGHYSPKINSQGFRQRDNCWSVDFKIDPGPPTKLDFVSIQVRGEAADLPEFKRFLAEPKLREGATLNHADYETAKKGLYALAASKGFFDAEITDKRLLVDPQRREAKVHLTLDSGPRYRIGILKLQATELDEDLVQRYQSVYAGDYYDSDKLMELQQALIGSEYFENVELMQTKDPLSKRIDVAAVLGERKQHVYTFHAGYSTDKGPRLGAGYKNRYLNSRGHRAKAELELSGIEELNIKAGASYSIPLDKPTNEWLTFAGTFEQEYTDTSETETYKLGARITRDIGNKWLRTLYADLMHENYEVAGVPGEATPLVLGGIYERIEKDNPKFIREGHKLRFEVLGAPVDFSDGTTFTQAKASAFLITSPLTSSRILLRGDLGATWADQQNRVPASFRYFAGGDRSVRGYEFESLGPLNAKGDVEGGLYTMVGSLEFEQLVAKDWSVAAFVDTGNAYDNNSDYDLYTGAGLGVRWHSPIGPIRVDLAHPFDDKDTDVRLHVGIGPEF